MVSILTGNLFLPSAERRPKPKLAKAVRIMTAAKTVSPSLGKNHALILASASFIMVSLYRVIRLQKMAHTKATGSTSNLRDSQPKYLGVKLFAGERAKVGSIIVRQRGTKFFPGENVRAGRDFTLYAVKDGTVKFSTKRKTRFDGKKRLVSVVSVL